MVLLIDFLQSILRLYQLVLLVSVVMSWVFASGRISRFDPRVRPVVQAIEAVTEPLLRRIRPWMPNTHPLDLAPLALWFLVIFISSVVLENSKCLVMFGTFCSSPSA